MSSLNKVFLIGNLGRDPDIRYMPNGEAVVNFSIATSESWNDRQSGQRVERTEWHNLRNLIPLSHRPCRGVKHRLPHPRLR